MKTWQKIVSIILAVSVITVAILAYFQRQNECCICRSFRYHAPCLIDLKTGKLIEMDLYVPDDKLVAELEDPQPDMGTFSFVRLGNASGTKLTDSKIIEIHIPNDKELFPMLCNNCRKQLPFGYVNRYVFADLYGMEEKHLIPIATNTSLSLRCYNLSMNKHNEKEGIQIVIEGTLDR